MISDESLVVAFAGGDQAAFETLIERYKGRIFRTVWALTGNYHDAEELTQDIFVTLFTKLTEFRGQSAFSTWLYTVTHNRVKNHKVRQHLRRALSLEWLSAKGQAEFADPDPLPHQTAEAREELVLLERSLAQLSFKLRQILVLRDYNDLSYEQMAKVLGCSIGTVKSRLARAKEKLAEIYHSHTPEGGKHHELATPLAV